jgi:hypothetical protein
MYHSNTLACLSTHYFSFNTLCKLQRNTESGSTDHSVTSKADREVFLKTVLFDRWSYSPELSLDFPPLNIFLSLAYSDQNTYINSQLKQC